MKQPSMGAIALVAGVMLPSVLCLIAGAQSVRTVPRDRRDGIAIEDPRVPISSLPFTITECGSYYLTRCLTGVTGQDGITINASNVTLDLNGFTLEGVPGSLHGVYSTSSDIVISNGTLKNWGQHGVRILARGLRFDGLKLDGNAGAGLFINGDSMIYDCAFTGNGQGVALSSGGDRTLIDSCLAHQNTSAGLALVGAGGIVMNCSVTSNGTGIVASSGGGWVVTDNVSSFNDNRGFDLCGSNLIKGNVANNQNNGSDTGEAIRVRCGGNLVLENLLVDNDTGIKTLSSPDVVARNCASEGSNNYDIGAGADAGPVGKAATSTSPWANIDD